MSNLETFAKEELERAGLFSKDSDYNGMVGHAVLKMVQEFSKEEGHSGFSAGMAIHIFEKLARWQNLTPITDNPKEWMDVSDYGGPDPPAMWQCKRNPALFSKDGGKTYYNIDENKRKFIWFNLGFKIYKSERHEKKD